MQEDLLVWFACSDTWNNSASWQWKDLCLEMEAFVFLLHQHFDLIFNASRNPAGPSFYLTTHSSSVQELLFMWEWVFGGVNAIDGNGLVVIKMSIQRLPVLVVLNHKSFCFYHDWYLYGSVFSVCFILLLLQSVLGLHWGSEKVFDCWHQRVKLHATGIVHGQMIPKRFVMAFFFCQLAAPHFLSSPHFHLTVVSERVYVRVC